MRLSRASAATTPLAFPRYGAPDAPLDDTVDAPLAELCFSSLALWPFERITYARLLYCFGYIVITVMGLMALVATAVFALLLAPIVAVRWYVYGARFAWQQCAFLLVDPLIFCDVWMHNLICPKPCRINIALDGYDLSPLLPPPRQAAPRFACRLKSRWNAMDIGFYFLAVRLILSGFAVAWFAYLVENVSTVVQSLQSWPNVQISFVASGTTANVHDKLGTFLLAIVLNCFMIVALRMCLVRFMCWSTRRYCCEHIYPSWMVRTSVTEVSTSMEPFA
ncbi:unnamed protein product [Aphanomyces euteiches]|uniref:Uncharacterized protein n=1 Tax=Aphanomyces euteiches TaxID=100861 RepID=A0A6G0XE51_9STRA|nr:hypothetical protein Ae201684_005710 [Aphanomyces euteiches]KAH9078611.1 hypothetical protein Ae201684P_019690 [Aphanomyces euteiches]KAH9144044.1 hypothetical protein AeRB84_011982 [Aphanomyces euteiches]